MKTAWISWRNWVSETGFQFIGSVFRPDAPASNVADPRPDVRAIGDIQENSIVVECRLGVWDGETPVEGVPVDVVGLIGTNFAPEGVGEGLVEFRLWDDVAGNDVEVSIQNRTYYGERDVLQTIAHAIEPADEIERQTLANVTRIRLTMLATTDVPWGTKDPFRGPEAWALTKDFPSLGTLWAGPMWRPKNGVGVAGYAETIVDPSDVTRAISGAAFAQVRKKLRQQSGRLLCVSRDEYARQPDGLAEMIAHAGISRPLFLRPTGQLEPIYGLLTEPIIWEVFDRSDDGIVGTAAYTIREIR